jgi:uncharacterized membrane protein YphA (DoxX/SURF4 family)
MSTQDAAASPGLSPPTGAPASRGLHIGLWVAQGFLALAFLMAGSFKLLTPVAEIAAKMAWARDASAPLIRFIGASELAGALGLILPSLTRIAPKLTGLAALGLVLVMVMAAGVHIAYGEAGGVPANLLLGGLAGFIAWGRLRAAPIPPRS